MGHLVTLHLIFLWISGFLHQPVVSLTPILTISSPTDHLRQGSTVILTCTIVNLDKKFFDGEGTIKFARRREGEAYEYIGTWTPTTNTVTESRFQISGYRNPDRVVVEFQMEGVTSEDASIYQCATFDNIGWVGGSNRHPLEMMKPPSPKFPICSVSWEGDMKERLKLDCYAERSVPPPKLVWYSDDMQISDAVIFRDYMYYENIIYIDNVTTINEEYVCRFYYSDGEIVDQRSCLVNKPHIKLFPDKPSFVLGGTTKFSVFSRAGPAIRKPLSCSRRFTDEMGVPQTDEVDVSLSGNDYGEVSIRHVSHSWNGSEISCSAENLVGISVKSITVLVEDHDKMNDAEIYVLPKDPLVVEGGEISFVCMRSYVLKDFQIEWFFAGRMISKSDTDDRYLINNEGQSLRLTNTTLSDDVQIVSCQVQIDNGVTLEASTDLRIAPVKECLNHGNQSACSIYDLSDSFSFYWEQHRFTFTFVILLSVFGMIFVIYLLIKCIVCVWRRKFRQVEGFPNVKCRIDSTSSKKYLLREEGMLFGPRAMQASIASDRPASVLTMNRTLPEVPLKRLDSVSENSDTQPAPVVQPRDVSYVDMHSSEDGSPPPPSYYSATLPVPGDIMPEHVTVMKVRPNKKRERHPSGKVPQDSQYQDCDCEDVFCDPYQELEDLYRERAESNAYIGKK